MHSNYKVHTSALGGKMIIVETGSEIICIPFDELNTDYLAYLAWVAEGNIAEEWSSDAS
jgi:hypothetical protein